MKKIVFLVQGSAATPYRLTFTKDNNNMNAFCTCPAGDNGQYCKHRLNILNGLSNNIVSNNKEEVHTIQELLKDTDLEKALFDFYKAEKEFESAKHKFQIAKKNIAIAMRS